MKTFVGGGKAGVADVSGDSDGNPGHRGDKASNEEQGLFSYQYGKVQLILFPKMAQHQHPILTDRSVHMMMVVLCLFHNDDHDESVRRVHEVSFMLFLFWFWTIVMG